MVWHGVVVCDDVCVYEVLFASISVVTFFLSAVLNNLTVTIVMVSLLRKVPPPPTPSAALHVHLTPSLSVYLSLLACA